MSKKLMIGIGLGFAGAAGLAAAQKCSDKQAPDMWVKLREKMEEMPADFPPRVMFDNVEETKANTAEILELLRSGAAQRENATASAN